MTAELARLDATAQAELVRSGEASPLELVDAAIDRIGQVNPQLNAVIHEFFEEARDVARSELPDGPFKGVPFLLKDLDVALAGKPMHMGMKLLKEVDFRPPVDSYLMQRFRRAGLVTLGKTNTPELGILPTTEPDSYGPSRNPWDPGRSTGGSSGGAGAAVASGMVPIAHASDGGGSIRIPASECGLVGLKPTRQRTTQGPIVGDTMSGLVVSLVVSRSVRDTAAILETVHGPAPGDPYVAPAPKRPYTEELGADPGELRVAVLDEPLVDVELDPVVVAAAREAARLLESLGHAIVEAPSVELGDADVGETFTTRWMAGNAATIAQLEFILDRKIGPDDLEPLTWALVEGGRQRTGADYLVAVAQHQALSRVLAGWFESGIDLLLTPTIGEVPPPLGTFDDSGPDPFEAFHRAYRTGTFTALFNATGNPAISLPLHWTDEGLPVGIQLVAPFGREDLLIRIASQLEQAQPWAERRPPVFAG